MIYDFMRMLPRTSVCGVISLFLAATVAFSQQKPDFRSWTLEEAVKVLNDSPWARQQTVTRVVSGVGSGVFGEKEIYHRYYVRFLSARPVREAFARIEQLTKGYDRLDESARRALDEKFAAQIGMDMSNSIVLAVCFRSNDPEVEQDVRRTLQSQTVETLKTRAYLSTRQFPQLELAAFFPASEDSVGAKFVFPRVVDGKPVVLPDDPSMVFELALPDEDAPRLRTVFKPKEMLRENLDVSSSVPNLAQIRDYAVQVNEVTQTISAGSQKLAEIVNVFPAKRGGLFHGSLYEYHRNDNLDARNFFDPVGPPLPEYKRNQFGATAGLGLGNRFHTQFSYDGLRIIRGSTLLSHVPTAEMKQGDFIGLSKNGVMVQLRDPITQSAFPGNQIPQSRLHPVAVKLLPLLPDPNRQDSSRNFINSQPYVSDQDTFSNRTDFEFNEASKVSFAYAYVRNKELEVHPLPAFGGLDSEGGQEATLSYDRTLSPNLVATAGLEFSREVQLMLPRNLRDTGLLASLGIPGLVAEDPYEEGYPAFELSGYRSFGDEGAPDGSVSNKFELKSNVSYVTGRHHLEFGGEIDWRQINDHRSPSLRRGNFSFTGIYTRDAFADFLLGLADSAGKTVGSSRQDLRRRGLELFVADEWKVNSHLSWSGGLLYDYTPPYQTMHANLSVFRPLFFDPPLEGELVNLESGTRSVVTPDRNNLAPSIGVAYRPFESDLLVVRAGYTIEYESPEESQYLSYMGRNYPFYYTVAAEASLDGPGLNLSMPFETAVQTELTVRDIEPHLHNTEIHQWRLTVENQVADGWELSATYEGEKANGMFRTLLANVPPPGSGPIQDRRPNPGFGSFTILTNGGSYSSHDLELRAEKQLSRGISFTSGLDWQRGFSDEIEEDPSDPRNLRAERASFDEPSVELFLNYIFDFPCCAERTGPGSSWLFRFLDGWRLAGITTFQSGSPFTVRMPGDVNNDGLDADRPDRIASGKIPKSQRNIDQWFDTTAFAAPPAFGFGNSGRNILLGPAYQNWDLSLVKGTRFPNGHRLEFRLELFNAFNKVNFEDPETTWGTSSFGQIFGAKRAREIEIALKYSF